MARPNNSSPCRRYDPHAAAAPSGSASRLHRDRPPVLGLTVCALACAGAVLGTPAAAHANLLRNPGAEAGAASGQGWDSVTIPGWKVTEGLPTVVRYGTRGFPAASRRARGADHGQLFAGGPGGTARLVQWVGLRAPDGGTVVAGAPYELSARLGGSSSSRASVSVSFFSAAGRRLSGHALPAVTEPARSSATRLSLRSLRGRLPAGAVRAEVTLRLSTSLSNVDGPSAPTVGYDRAVADDVRSTCVRISGPPGR